MKWLSVIIMLTSATALCADAQDVCEPGTAEAFLEGNDVRAAIYNNGALFWRGGQNVYEVPAGSGIQAMFSSSLWMGGMVDGKLRFSATRYGPWELWPGPLGATDCEPWDRIYSVTTADLDAWNASGAVTEDMLDWPWTAGAPVTDGDDNPNNYELSAGDHPELLGDQTLWWIMNDAGGIHRTVDTLPLQMEVEATAFASNLNPPLTRTTFYRYRFTYKGSSPLIDAYLALHVDSDLGDRLDDAIASDTTLGMGYSYNFDDYDEGRYGEAPPAVGVVLLDAPTYWKTDSDPGHLDARTTNYMTSMMHWMIPVGSAGDYFSDYVGIYYNYMRGLWGTGETQKEGGNGLNATGIVTPFSYPGEPGEYWSELASGQEGEPRRGDRRFVISNGPFNLEPGESTTFYFAIVWSRGRDNLDSVRRLKRDAAIVKQVAPTLLKPIYEYKPDIPPEPDYPLGANGIYPNPASDTATLDYSLPQPMHVRVEVFDVLGRRVFDGTRGMRDAGEYTAHFDVADWPAGVYTARLQLDRITTTKTFSVVR